MKLLHVPGKDHVLADGLSHRPDFRPVEHVVPISHDYSSVPTEVDVLVTDCYESLTRGRPVAEIHCPQCQVALPPEPLL